jgi:hypothetical protein
VVAARLAGRRARRRRVGGGSGRGRRQICCAAASDGPCGRRPRRRRRVCVCARRRRRKRPGRARQAAALAAAVPAAVRCAAGAGWRCVRSASCVLSLPCSPRRARRLLAAGRWLHTATYMAGAVFLFGGVDAASVRAYARAVRRAVRAGGWRPRDRPPLNGPIRARLKPPGSPAATRSRARRA